MGLIRLSDLVHEHKLALVVRFDEEGTESRALLASLLRRNLNMSNTIPPSTTEARWSRERTPPGPLAWSSGLRGGALAYIRPARYMDGYFLLGVELREVTRDIGRRE